jgi:hypothetical protein
MPEGPTQYPAGYNPSINGFFYAPFLNSPYNNIE